MPTLPAAFFLLLLGAPSPLLPPLAEDLGLTASFGEYRFDHLHAGVDFSTGGETGLPVRAAADGEIFRIKVEWRGYGNALYVRHPGGLVTVYAHLEGFAAEGLRERVEAQRKKTGKRYFGTLEIVPPVPVKRGEVIAFSGESGAGLPHFHLETRLDGTPADPYDAGLAYAGDRTPPVLESWIIDPLDPDSAVDGGVRGPREIPVSRVGSPVRLRPGDYVVSLRAHDPFPREARGGLRRIEARLDGERIYLLSLGGFDFGEPPVGLLFDRALSHILPTTYVYRLARLPGNDYRGATGAPVIHLEGEGPHTLSVTATDGSGNRAEATLAILCDPSLPPAGGAPCSSCSAGTLHLVRREHHVEFGRPTAPGRPHATLTAFIGDRIVGEASGGKLGAFADPPDLPGDEIAIRENGQVVARIPRMPLHPGKAASLTLGPLRLTVPAGAVYYPAVAGAEASPFPKTGPLRLLGRAWALLPDALPFRRDVTVSIRLPDGEPPDRAGLYGYDPVTESWGFLGKDYNPKTRTFSTGMPLLGTVALLRDESPPAIGEPAYTGSRLRVPADETGEGIGRLGVSLRLDGRPLDTEWDPDRRWAFTWDPIRITPGDHALEIEARDLAGNVSRKTVRLHIP